MSFATIYCYPNTTLADYLPHYKKVKSKTPTHGYMLYYEGKNHLAIMGNCTVILDDLHRIFTTRLEALYQAATIWEYMLCENNDYVDFFSVSRKFWETYDEETHDDQQQWRGDYNKVAQLFSVDASRISNYYQTWEIDWTNPDYIENLIEYGKAYPDDQCCRGQVHQLVDFLNALGLGWPVHNLMEL
ncbi:MAG: hypothetical protein R3B84_01140 [Zavarzinella sp.]